MAVARIFCRGVDTGSAALQKKKNGLLREIPFA
jgi:hypothetical protein